ncbi:MAG TPA: acyl-CoA dehydrogenase family protein [Syntrophales bacterium]|mgnify:FL=1|nr:acyl-CoA dehydrogenase family protein [Syntrophales bacterium]HPX55335.1 acyl-CoA dehydrogenase family protein [Syntrophales bacterium]HQA81743.1 acyl-CoA dehydrogenase family protein [Syntrophales bacterium]
MDFKLDENQQMYFDMVTKFVKNEITPFAMTWDKEHAFPWGTIQKAWELGILNLSVPESVKGYEVDVVSTTMIIRELSYGDTGISTSAMCNDLANTVIAQHGTDEQKQMFLKPFVDEPLLASFCLTEPNAGSDNSAMTTFIRKLDNDNYVLNGAKCFITNASYASQFTVFCKVGKPSSQLMACVIVPAPPLRPSDLSGPITMAREIVLPKGGKILIGKPEDKLGQRLSNTASVTFEDVIIEPHQIIGDRRRGFQYVVDVLDYARPMVAAIGVGLARRALDVTLAYTRERKQFGQRICDMPVARDMLVQMWRRVELAELALMKAAVKVQDKDEDRGVYASLAKNVAAEAGLFCANEGLHLHGGYGFTMEYEISKLVRDAHIIDIYEGVREVQNMIIGREIV